MFDNYTLRARYYPVIILFSPIVILGFFYSYQYATLIHLLASTGVASVLTYLFSQLGRDQGKRKEPHLWQNWGGAPSIQLLRLTNKRIDPHTKKRYHERLLHLCPVSNAPTLRMEQHHAADADNIYQAWTKYLIGQTRDKKKYGLLFKENTNYGFRRNLWGLRPMGIWLTVMILIGNYCFWAIKMKSSNVLTFPDTFRYSTLALILVLLFWLFVVRRSWVRLVAFAYAERLCEAVEHFEYSNNRQV